MVCYSHLFQIFPQFIVIHRNWDVKPAFHLFRKLYSIYTWKQDLSSLDTKKAPQDYLQKQGWGGQNFLGSPVIKTSYFQEVKVWSLVRELRSYILNLAKGGKNAILKNKTKKGGLWASQGWNWDPAELTSCFLFPFCYQLKRKNKYLSCLMLSFFSSRLEVLTLQVLI